MRNACVRFQVLPVAILKSKKQQKQFKGMIRNGNKRNEVLGIFGKLMKTNEMRELVPFEICVGSLPVLANFEFTGVVQSQLL